MTIDSLPQNFMPAMGRIVMEGMQEIVGRAGMFAAFNTAHLTHLLPGGAAGRPEAEFTGKDFGSLQLALVTLYGPRGGHGIALRAGRASFAYLLRRFGDPLGLTTLEYRLLPSMSRIKTGLQALAVAQASFSGGEVEILDEPGAWLWKYTGCPWGSQYQAESPTCHFVVGLLQEFLAWASGGRMYHVVEVECAALGKPACLMRIDKQPFD